jgi:hypothetical protein
MERRSTVGLLLFIAVMLLWLTGSGCAVRSLHPRTGEATDTIFDRQAKRRRAGPPVPMTGEEAEIALKNYEQRTKLSDTKVKPNSTVSIMQLQR